MKLERKIWLKLGLLGILGFVVVVAFLGEEYIPAKEEDKSPKSEQKESRPPEVGNFDHLVFITTSQGCQCTLERNQKAKELMEQIQKDFPGLKVKNLDYIFNHMEALPFLQKNQISFLPALLFIDANGQVLDKIAGFLDPKTVQEKIQRYQKVKTQDKSLFHKRQKPDRPSFPRKRESSNINKFLDSCFRRACPGLDPGSDNFAICATVS